MDKLLKIGISEETIDKMIEVNDIFPVEDLNEDYTNTYKIIGTLKEIKVDDEAIDMLLINFIDLFLMDYDDFTAKLKGKDLTDVANRINYDLTAVEEIFLGE